MPLSDQAVGITNEEEKIRQTFQILECDYGLQDGSTKRKIKQRIYQAKHTYHLYLVFFGLK